MQVSHGERKREEPVKHSEEKEREPSIGEQPPPPGGQSAKVNAVFEGKRVSFLSIWPRTVKICAVRKRKGKVTFGELKKKSGSLERTDKGQPSQDVLKRGEKKGGEKDLSGLGLLTRGIRNCEKKKKRLVL